MKIVAGESLFDGLREVRLDLGDHRTQDRAKESQKDEEYKRDQENVLHRRLAILISPKSSQPDLRDWGPRAWR